MYKILPYPKKIEEKKSDNFKFKSICFNLKNCIQDIEKIKKAVDMKLSGQDDLSFSFDFKENENSIFFVNIHQTLEKFKAFVDAEYLNLFEEQGYVIEVKGGIADVYFEGYKGVVHSISTIKQLICIDSQNNLRYVKDVYILDYPVIEKRSLSTTFAWYAGYGRVGFDMQLWGYEQWKGFIDFCSDFKITQLNLCMYGYWPLEFEEYPETIFKDFNMKAWNRESKNWLSIKYTHPNLTEEFLSKIIEYAHFLGIEIYTYVGLNSYNGGYSNVHREKRMKLPPDSKFINDFDTLCLSDESTIDYLKTAIRKVASLGVDGIIFEESEESFWFCNCEKCKERFLNKTPSPAEAKHKANYWLLNIFHKEIKSVNPNCNIGLRAWREPPLEKDINYLKKCEASIPKDVCLYWAPGLYVNDDEFKKWVQIFGKDRICARDTEANAISACNGRLIRIFRENILRANEETNHQHIDNDYIQHKGSAALKVKGINGYLFEFYGFFIHFFMHSNFGWDSSLTEEEFYDYAMSSVFGDKLGREVLYVLKNLLTIHESQIKLFTSEFPFMRNKVNKNDILRINEAKANWQNIMDKIDKIKNSIKEDNELKKYLKHFEKIENSHRRSKEIYEICLSAIAYDNADTDEEKIRYLKLVDYYNEKDFDVVKELFFDVGVIEATGIKDSMFPYHELKRIINNILHPDSIDYKQIYLGVEALGWLWL